MSLHLEHITFSLDVFVIELIRFHIISQCLVKLLLMIILKTPRQGAQTTIYCAVAEELEGVSGRYFGDCCEEELKTVVAAVSYTHLTLPTILLV